MKILLPTDQSDNARHALNYALQLYKGEEVEFVLFQSFDIPAYTDAPLPLDSLGTEEIERILVHEVQSLRKEHEGSTFRFSTKVLAGSLSFNVEQMVEEDGVDMVIMGTKGASGIAAALIGSNTADVIQTASCPVLAVPEGASLAAPSKILFATDNKGLSSPDIIDPMLSIAKKYDAEIHLMNVLDEGKMSSVEEAVAGLKLDHQLEGVKHSFHFENSNDKAQAIEDHLSKHQIEMLGVVPRKNNFFDSIFHRSVTRKLALHTKVPLLAMHDLG